ncbi:zinc-finger homeodomain protein 3-like [Cynara cardunculus var. scolymus]|uniref:zinc-finger homeodomain protein 3-like n=1 Tax=Cynara cardunculus var. scolymus TaxID=59895 RepID=UPI000D629C93|nr:zinc-finger homeodomain protein 3-like [Cynara cardunculus var. scolymus]
MIPYNILNITISGRMKDGWVIINPRTRAKMEFPPEEEVEEEGEMALPISSTYGDGQLIHHDHILPLSLQHHQQQQPPPSATSMEDISKKMAVVVRYKECLKNHAAAMGGKATDGCGEFMACGEEGTLEALTCSVCNCHRNFHRKEIDDGHHHHHHHPIRTTSYDCKSFGYNHNNAGALVPSIKGPPPKIMSYNMAMGSFPSESDYQEDGGGFMSRHPLAAGAAPAPHMAVKKRFRTKFTHEQKEKMLVFADKIGWKMQKQEESMIQDFCQEIGIKRRVLKVWMHNNKQNLAKNTCCNSISINPPQDPN